MPRIFISYSRVDKSPFVEGLVTKLRDAYGYNDIWYDEELTGGEIWWEKILSEIAQCDIFLYVLSNESVRSDYCQAEFEEARRLQKFIIPVQARDRTKLTGEIRNIQIINMTKGVEDATVLPRLFGAINKYLNTPNKRRKPLWEPPTPKPHKITDNQRPENSPHVVTPDLVDPANKHVQLDQTSRYPLAILTAVAILALLVIIVSLQQRTNPSLTPTVNSVSSVATNTLISNALLDGTSTNVPNAIAITPRRTVTAVPQVTALEETVVARLATQVIATQDAATQDRNFELASTAVTTIDAALTLTIQAIKQATQTQAAMPSRTPTNTATITPHQTATAVAQATAIEETVIARLEETQMANEMTPQTSVEPTPTIDPTPAHTATLSVSETPTLEPEATEEVTVMATVLRSANLRAGPGTNYDQVGFAEPGEEMGVIAKVEENDLWYLARFNEEEVWIWSGLVEIERGLPIPIVATIPRVNLLENPSNDITAENSNDFESATTTEFGRKFYGLTISEHLDFNVTTG